MVSAEIEATMEEHFNNIAFVVLGAVDMTEEDTAFAKMLNGKYKALRDQIFVFGILETKGSLYKQ